MAPLSGMWANALGVIGTTAAIAGFIYFWRDLLDAQCREFRNQSYVLWESLKDAYDDYIGTPQPRSALGALPDDELKRFLTHHVYPEAGDVGVKNPAALHNAHSKMSDLLEKWANRPIHNPYFSRSMYKLREASHDDTLRILEATTSAYAERENIPVDHSSIEDIRDIWRKEEVRQLMRGNEEA